MKSVENKFRIKQTKLNKSFEQEGGFFSSLREKLKIDTYFDEGFPVEHLPKILFVMLLGLLYINNAHFAEKTVREIDHIQSEVEDLRADYTTLKADLMFDTKQSEVARRIQSVGLKESLTPPFKIVVNEDEY